MSIIGLDPNRICSFCKVPLVLCNAGKCPECGASDCPEVVNIYESGWEDSYEEKREQLEEEEQEALHSEANDFGD